MESSFCAPIGSLSLLRASRSYRIEVPCLTKHRVDSQILGHNVNDITISPLV